MDILSKFAMPLVHSTFEYKFRNGDQTQFDEECV